MCLEKTLYMPVEATKKPAACDSRHMNSAIWRHVAVPMAAVISQLRAKLPKVTVLEGNKTANYYRENLEIRASV